MIHFNSVTLLLLNWGGSYAQHWKSSSDCMWWIALLCLTSTFCHGWYICLNVQREGQAAFPDKQHNWHLSIWTFTSNIRVLYIDSPSVARGLRYFSTLESGEIWQPTLFLPLFNTNFISKAVKRAKRAKCGERHETF